jgi:hypothetical protein
MAMQNPSKNSTPNTRQKYPSTRLLLRLSALDPAMFSITTTWLIMAQTMAR